MKREMVLDMAGGGIPASFCLLLHSSVSSVFSFLPLVASASKVMCLSSLPHAIPTFSPLSFMHASVPKRGKSKGPFCHTVVDSHDTTPTLA